MKSSKKLFSDTSETDDGLSSCSNFPERLTETELQANRNFLSETEHLKGKISDKELDSLKAVLNWNADVFSNHKADIGCCNFVEHEIETQEVFDRSDLIPTNIRLAAANQGATYVTGRTPIISLQLGVRHLLMSFLVVENLDESNQFILGRDFVRNFNVTINLNDGLIRFKDPERKYEKKPLYKLLINQAKLPIFLDRKVRLKPNQAVVATFRMRNLNGLSYDRQVYLVPTPNSKSSAILGRSFSLTQSGLCVSVLLNPEATTVTIQRGKKLGYVLPLTQIFRV